MSKKNYLNYLLETKIIHCGSEPDPLTGAMTAPIYQTATYALEEIGKTKGYNYSRTINPTVCALEQKLSQIENALGCIACRTGLAATTVMVLALLKSGDHIICTNVMFGGTIRLFNEVFAKFGLTVTYVDTTDIDKITRSIEKNTRMLFIETPANPLLTITDIAQVSKLAKAHDIILVVDNTFLTAVGQRPLELGADIVLYSTTKYIDGHNATIGGALLTNEQEHLSAFDFMRNASGCIQAPHDAWLTLQGMKTLHIRLQQHCHNAQTVANYLEKHKKINYVVYPGLNSFPQYSLAKKQQLCFGGILIFEVNGNYGQALKVMNNLKLCSLAESLGTIESLISHPASMTHKGLTPKEREKIGISDNLIRLSVGLENVSDIIDDLDQALNK